MQAFPAHQPQSSGYNATTIPRAMSFLRRSKSTREVSRSKISRDQTDVQFTQNDTPFFTRNNTLHRGFSTTRGRRYASPPPPPSASSTTNTTSCPPPPPPPQQQPAARYRKLGRRKSISSTRESKMALGIPESWEPPAPAPTPAERKRRTSIFFGLPVGYLETMKETPPPLPPTPAPAQPKRAAPPPPIKLSAFPPRRSDSGEIMIGMAIGSPSGGEVMMTPGALGVDDTMNSSTSRVKARSPSFVLPNTPFGLLTESVPVRAQTSHGKYGKNDSVSIINKMENSFGSSGNSTKAPLPEEPKTAGWRKRIFGKSLFKRTPSSAAREPMPESVIAEPVPVRPAAVHDQTKVGYMRLDVAIPNVELERYSVMFDTLLHPSEGTKNSLYHRRKSRELTGGQEFGTSAALSTLTSGSSHTSAGLSPPSPNNLGPNANDTGLRRTATTTGSHLSPRSPLSRLGDDLRRLSTSPSNSLHRAQTSAVDGRPPPSPNTNYTYSTLESTTSPPDLDQGFNFDPDRDEYRISRISEASRSSASSTPSTPRGSFDAGDDEWLTREDEAEPLWEMVTTKKANNTRQEVTTTRRDNNHNNNKNSNVVEVDAHAQISIARQISISQRQLYVPKKLISRKEFRPRIVDHRTSLATGTGTGRGHVPRGSEAGVVGCVRI